MYPGYGYAAYPYSPATSPAPQVGGDGQLYGAQQYQYPTFFPTVPFATTPATQGDLSANKAGGGVKTLPAESKNVGSAAGVGAKGSNGPAPGKPNSQQTAINNASSNFYGNGGPGSGFATGYQDPRYSYDAYYGNLSSYDASKYSDGQRAVTGGGVTSSYSKGASVPSSRNQNYRSNSSYTVWFLSNSFFLVLTNAFCFIDLQFMFPLCAGCAPGCSNGRLRFNSGVVQQDVSKQVIQQLW